MIFEVFDLILINIFNHRVILKNIINIQALQWK
jgi:hypothetical protein